MTYAALGSAPITVAPMGGGPSTPQLVAAAAEAGALGFLAAAYKSPSEVEKEIAEVRAVTTAPFGVNVFVPGAPTTQPDRLATYVAELRREADALGTDIGAPLWDDDHWTEKTDLLLETAPPLCSFTFGCPARALMEALKRRGIVVMVTVTNPDEARVAAERGADALCAQGAEAGGHRGSFTDDDGADEKMTTLALVARLHASVDVPIVAAGGIATPEDVRSALEHGAVAVQAGTAFLRCDESGADPLHKGALVDAAYTGTAFTRSFSGRRARGLVNRFMRDHQDAPSAFPEVNNATRPLRAAARQRSDTQAMSLWAGTGHRQALEGPAAHIIDWLCSETA